MAFELFGILDPTPCASLPTSFAFTTLHSFPLILFAVSSSMQAVMGLTAVLENSTVPSMVMGGYCGNSVT